MRVVLVMLNNIQDYILDNIKNLNNFGNLDIIVITDRKFQDLFISGDIICETIAVDDLISDYSQNISKLGSTFRGGFWKLTT